MYQCVKMDMKNLSFQAFYLKTSTIKHTWTDLKQTKLKGLTINVLSGRQSSK